MRLRFRTEQELVEHFASDGDLLNKETNTVYIADIGGEPPVLNGIMVARYLPPDVCHSAKSASEWALANRPAPGSGAHDAMLFMGVPGYWFHELFMAVWLAPKQFDAAIY